MTEQKLKLLDILAQELGELSDEEFAKGIERLDKIFKSGQVEPEVMPNEVLAVGGCTWEWTYKNPNRIIADCKAPMGQFYVDYDYKYCPNCGRKVIVKKSKPA